MCSNEFQNVTAWLNGDQCSNFVSNCVISDIEEVNAINLLEVFPNPSSDFLNINCSADGVFQLKNCEGKAVTNQINFERNEIVTINSSQLKAGIYFYQFTLNNSLITGKVIIVK